MQLSSWRKRISDCMEDAFDQAEDTLQGMKGNPLRVIQSLAAITIFSVLTGSMLPKYDQPQESMTSGMNLPPNHFNKGQEEKAFQTNGNPSPWECYTAYFDEPTHTAYVINENIQGYPVEMPWRDDDPSNVLPPRKSSKSWFILK